MSNENIKLQKKNTNGMYDRVLGKKNLLLVMLKKINLDFYSKYKLVSKSQY